MLMKLLALVLITYGLFELFLRNLLRNLRSRNPYEHLTWRIRMKRFRKSMPAYAAVLVGVLLFIASMG